MPNHTHKVEKYEKLGSNLHPKKCQNYDWRFLKKGITRQHSFKEHHAIHDNKNVCVKNWDWHFMHYFSYPPWCPWSYRASQNVMLAQGLHEHNCLKHMDGLLILLAYNFVTIGAKINGFETHPS
jgi:hypothetical protein